MRYLEIPASQLQEGDLLEDPEGVYRKLVSVRRLVKGGSIRTVNDDEYPQRLKPDKICRVARP